jgi:katanin p60 ATPase-containing subunit A1
VVRTQGSLYVFAKLPEGVDDMAAIKYLSHQHKVCVLPGKGAHVRVCVCVCVVRVRWCVWADDFACGAGFGAPGHLRVSFGNLPPEVCEQAALRLKQGLQDIVDGKLSL